MCALRIRSSGVPDWPIFGPIYSRAAAAARTPRANALNANDIRTHSASPRDCRQRKRNAVNATNGNATQTQRSSWQHNANARQRRERNVTNNGSPGQNGSSREPGTGSLKSGTTEIQRGFGVRMCGPLLGSAVRLCGRSERFSPHLRPFGLSSDRFGARTLIPSHGLRCNLQDVPESLPRAHWCAWFALERLRGRGER